MALGPGRQAAAKVQAANAKLSAKQKNAVAASNAASAKSRAANLEFVRKTGNPGDLVGIGPDGRFFTDSIRLPTVDTTGTLSRLDNASRAATAAAVAISGQKFAPFPSQPAKEVPRGSAAASQSGQNLSRALAAIFGGGGGGLFNVLGKQKGKKSTLLGG